MAHARKENPLRSASIVVGALAFGWLAMELAFKPLLDKVQAAMDKTDRARESDDGVKAEKEAKDFVADKYEEEKGGEEEEEEAVDAFASTIVASGKNF